MEPGRRSQTSEGTPAVEPAGGGLGEAAGGSPLPEGRRAGAGRTGGQSRKAAARWPAAEGGGRGAGARRRVASPRSSRKHVDSGDRQAVIRNREAGAEGLGSAGRRREVGDDGPRADSRGRASEGFPAAELTGCASGEAVGGCPDSARRSRVAGLGAERALRRSSRPEGVYGKNRRAVARSPKPGFPKAPRLSSRRIVA